MTLPKQGHGARNIGIAVLVIIVLILFAYLVYPQLVSRTPAVAYPNVTVSGGVTTVGVGTSPISITFRSDNGQSSTATVNNGLYSISLPNGHDYNLTVSYKAAAGLTTSTCNAGSLNLNVQASSYSYSMSC